MNSSQALEYANVLHDLAIDSEQVLNTLESLKCVLEDKEIVNFFNHPKISSDEKKRILKQSLQLNDGDLLYFIYVLVDNNKLLFVEDIISAYNEIKDEKLGIMRFTVYSSKALDESIKDEIKKALYNTYYKNIVLKCEIDDKIIGGIVIKHNNSIIDNSILNKLNNIKKVLSSN